MRGTRAKDAAQCMAALPVESSGMSICSEVRLSSCESALESVSGLMKRFINVCRACSESGTLSAITGCTGLRGVSTCWKKWAGASLSGVDGRARFRGGSCESWRGSGRFWEQYVESGWV